MKLASAVGCVQLAPQRVKEKAAFKQRKHKDLTSYDATRTGSGNRFWKLKPIIYKRDCEIESMLNRCFGNLWLTVESIFISSFTQIRDRLVAELLLLQSFMLKTQEVLCSQL